MRLPTIAKAWGLAAFVAVASAAAVSQAQDRDLGATPGLVTNARTLANDAADRGVAPEKLQPLAASVNIQTTERGLNFLIAAIAHLSAECRGAPPSELGALQSRLLDPSEEAQGLDASRRLAADAVAVMNRYHGRCGAKGGT